MNLHGLTEVQVQENRTKYGKNEIEEKAPETLLQKMLDAVKDPLLILLLAIATFMLVLSFLGQAEWYESVGTYIAVVIVAYVTARTGVSADQKYKELKDSTKHEDIKVMRDGVLKVIDVSEIVVGDVVVLQTGDKIPADGYLVDGNITVNNSSLNGETEECKKSKCDDSYQFPTEVKGDTLVDSHTLFKGTTVYNGEGHMIVSRVGMKTMMGEMAAEMAEDEVDSPLKVKLAILAGQISKFGYIGAIIIGVAYMIHYVMSAGGFSVYMQLGLMQCVKDLIASLSIAIIIVVCAVPEGLPLMIALVLQANAGKMLDLNVLVRKAIGIETAGSLNVLFSDKTGTITKGQLEVVQFFCGDCSTIEKDDVFSKDVIKDRLCQCIALNTSARFDANHNVTGGNITDKALLDFLGETNFSNCTYEVTEFQPFNSANKFSQSRVDDLHLTLYKGAPERLVTKAKYCLDSTGELVKFDKEALNKKIDELAECAMRVLAFGYSTSSMVQDTVNDDIVIVGLVAIRDDVRPEAKQAIGEVQDAGIQVVMITGDRLETAVAIGKDAGLLNDQYVVLTKENVHDIFEGLSKDNTVALSSDTLNSLKDDEVKQILPQIRVIARALPKDKSRMVRLTQEINLVCGMTGDGVNDSPALKRADVGFAMGSGTEAAKEAGDLVILDDNFMSIKNAIWYGRTIYHNILKFCKFQLAINVGAVLVSAILPFFGVEEALTVTQLLFVNLCMDSLGSLMLGNEPAMLSYMHERPRRRDESIVNKKMFMQFTCIGLWLTALSFFWFFTPYIHAFFSTEEQWKTGFFAMFMFAAILNGFNVRNEGFNVLRDIDQNMNFIKVLSAMLISTVVISSISIISPVIGNMFSTQAFGVTGWYVVCLIGLTVIPIDMLRKLLFRTYKNN